MIYFAHSSALWFLPLSILPILIHLINLHRHKKIYFSNVALIKQIEKETRNIRKIKDWLLLTIRTLVIIFIILAFATPKIKHTKQEKKFATNNTVAIYIDNSFSMSLQNSNGTLLEIATNNALKIVSELFQNYNFHLITNSGYYENLNLKELTQKLTNIHYSGEIFTFKELQNYLSQKQIHKVLIFSDLQASFLSTNFLQKDSTTSYYFFPVYPSTTANLSLDTCFLENPNNLPQNKLIFTITNYSRHDAASVPVTLNINGKMKNITNVSVEANDRTTDTIPFSYSGTSRFLKGTLSINDYPTTFDNKLYFTYQVANEHKILIISNNNKNIFPYFQSAFSNIDDKNKTKIQVININQIGTVNLKDFDVIVLDKIEEYPSEFEDKILETLKNGTSVIFLPDFSKTTTSANLLKTITGQKISKIDTGNFYINKIETNNPLYKNAILNTTKNTELPILKKLFIISNISSKGNTIISTEDGYPVLQNFTISNGHFYFFNFDYSVNKDFATSPLFFVAIYRITTSGHFIDNLYYYCNSPTSFVVSANLDNDKMLKLVNTTNNAEKIPYQLRTGETTKIVLNKEDIASPGFYKIIADTATISLLAFNYNRVENNFKYTTVKQLKSLSNKINLNIYNSETIKNGNIEEINDKDLTFWMIIIVLILLTTETLLLKFYKK